jgi:fatty acid desaturase
MRTRAACIPARANLALAAAVVALHLAALIVLPAIGAATWVLAIVAALLALGTPTHWALIHEAIHGLLLPRRGANEHLARLLAVLFGVPFRAVRFAHLRHHRYNRTPWGREEVYDPTRCPRALAYALHYLRITFGLYAGELALSLLCWLPRSLLQRRLHALCPDTDDGAPGMAVAADREVLGSAALAQIRFDAASLVSLYGISAVLYGHRWSVLATLLIVRAFVSSQLDHAPHHGTPLEQREHALNLSAPRWLRALLLNFNFHRTHHQHPNLPWRSLPAFATLESGDMSFARAVMRQWRGPIAAQGLASASRTR